MFKKIGLTVVLSSSLIFGGALTASAASTSDSSPNDSYKTFTFQIGNGEWKEIDSNRINEFMKNHFPNLSINWENKEGNQKDNDKEKENNEETSNETNKEGNEQSSNQVEQENQDKQETEQAPEESENESPAEEPSQNVETPEENVEEPSENNQAGDQYQVSQYEQEVVDLTNQEREKEGLAPLKVDLELSRVAREKSNDMAENGYFSHTSPSYGSPFDMIKSYGISYTSAGENIAKGQRSPEEVVTGWMNSEGHRANILNGSFTHIGVGYVEQSNHWTQQFIGK